MMNRAGWTVEEEEGDGFGAPVPIRDIDGFLSENDFDDELCAHIRGLALDEALVLGGGAAPHVRIRREAPLMLLDLP